MRNVNVEGEMLLVYLFVLLFASALESLGLFGITLYHDWYRIYGLMEWNKIRKTKLFAFIYTKSDNNYFSNGNENNLKQVATIFSQSFAGNSHS